jgi:hypothetical protein
MSCLVNVLSLTVYNTPLSQHVSRLPAVRNQTTLTVHNMSADCLLSASRYRTVMFTTCQQTACCKKTRQPLLFITCQQTACCQQADNPYCSQHVSKQIPYSDVHNSPVLLWFFAVFGRRTVANSPRPAPTPTLVWSMVISAEAERRTYVVAIPLQRNTDQQTKQNWLHWHQHTNHTLMKQMPCLMKPPPQRGDPLLWCLSLLERVGELWRERECGEVGLLLPPPGVLLPDCTPVPPAPQPEAPLAFMRASW